MEKERRVSLVIEESLYEKIEADAKKNRRSINLTITLVLEKIFGKKKSD